MIDYSRYDDTQLLSLLAQNDESAFTEIYHRYWEKLFYKAGKKLGDLSEAENIVQDIFLDIWQRRSKLEVTGDLSHYLAVALKYRVINYQNRYAKKATHQAHVSLQDTAADRTTEEWLAYSELNRCMAALVAGLPEKCQLAFRLREEGLSQQQIADKMGVSENTVETHIGRALKSLRKGLTLLFSLL
ncbi:MAG TPA: RNA polymerase sigma-70 factor [Chitinophagaceae bacterium]|nr:RNA polymerase sigma-70 factor [Chitinophagaceae bacterium]